MTHLEVRRRGHDYLASVCGEPGKWASGPTPDAAVRDLVGAWAIAGPCVTYYRVEGKREGAR